MALGPHGQRIGNKKPATYAGTGIFLMRGEPRQFAVRQCQAASAFTRAFSREILRETVFL